jgi:hypothetical protein
MSEVVLTNNQGAVRNNLPKYCYLTSADVLLPGRVLNIQKLGRSLRP